MLYKVTDNIPKNPAGFHHFHSIDEKTGTESGCPFVGHENKVAEQHLHIRDQAVGREQRKLEEHAAHLSWDVTDEMKPASQKYCVARISESGIRKTPELRVHHVAYPYVCPCVPCFEVPLMVSISHYCIKRI